MGLNDEQISICWIQPDTLDSNNWFQDECFKMLTSYNKKTKTKQLFSKLDCKESPRFIAVKFECNFDEQMRVMTLLLLLLLLLLNTNKSSER